MTQTTEAITQLMSEERQWSEAAPSTSAPGVNNSAIDSHVTQESREGQLYGLGHWEGLHATPLFLLQNQRPYCLKEFIVLRQREGDKFVKSKE